MRIDDALSVLRALPTAEARARAARPLLDRLRAPAGEPVAGWLCLLDLVHALDPDLPMRTSAAIVRTRESCPNTDAPGRDLDSLVPDSRLLQEPFRLLCTPVRSPAADGALLRLHLPPWIFCAANHHDGSFPSLGIPIRIVPTSAGPRLDFSEGVQPGPFGHWQYAVSRLRWPNRHAPEFLRGRLLRYVRKPVPARFLPAVLPDIASRAAQVLEALAVFLPPDTLSALRRLREADIHALAAMAPPDPENARRRAQFMRAHPVHAALILHAYHPEHRGARPSILASRPIPSLGTVLEWIDCNCAPARIVGGLTGARIILPTSRPLRRSRANLTAELDILQLCSASPRRVSHRLRSLPGEAWFRSGPPSPAENCLPDNRFAAAAAEVWLQDPRLRDERIRFPRRHLERLCRAVCHARCFVQLPAFPPQPVHCIRLGNPTAILPPRMLIQSLAAGAHDALPEDPSHLQDAVAAWIDDCLVPQIEPDQLQAMRLACRNFAAPGNLAAVAACAACSWLHAPFADSGPLPEKRFPCAPPDLLLPPAALNRWAGNWRRAVTRPNADSRFARSPQAYPSLPASFQLPPGVTPIRSGRDLVQLTARQQHCVNTYELDFRHGFAFCFSILHGGSETTLTIANPEPGAPASGLQIKEHRGYRNRKPPPGHCAIAEDVLRGLRAARLAGPEHFPRPRPDADLQPPGAPPADPEIAWAVLHHASVPEALHALRPGTGLLPRLIAAFVLP